MPYYRRRPFSSFSSGTATHFQPTGPQKARILQSAKPKWYDISTPYNADFVQNIKSLIAPSMRSYDPATKMWSCHAGALAEVVDLLKVYYDEVINCVPVEDNKPQDLLCVFDELFKMIPGEYQDKVYKALVQAVHPDHGGSNDNMVKLNKAYGDNKK